MPVIKLEKVMDNCNLFETPSTYRLIRLEYLAALFISLGFAVSHYHEIRWWVFALLFSYIDLIGYLPGALAYKIANGKQIPKIFYILYNSMHSLLSALLVAALWAWFVKPEWALLAIPIHLSGDRSIFGNFLKPFNVSFEPTIHPEYKRFLDSYKVGNLLTGETECSS
jgi:hypothetical protein